MRISVIIPCRNAAGTIEAQLHALSRQQWRGGWEVIVADNGSTDGTRHRVARFKDRLPGLRSIDASLKRGAAHARNAAASVASGDALAFCDADDEAGDGWLAAIGNALSCHDFVASRMDVKKLNSPGLVEAINNVQGRELRRAPYPPFLFHAGSSGMGVKKSLHDRVGGFDESLREREDTDYCFRIQLAGVALHFAAEAIMHIRYSDRPIELFRQARRWARYQVLLYKRYGGSVPLDRPWLAYLLTWRDLAACMAKLFRSETRLAWMKGAGTQIGLLEGAIRYRMPPVCQLGKTEAVAKVAALFSQSLIGEISAAPNGGVLSLAPEMSQPSLAQNEGELREESGAAAEKVVAWLVTFGAQMIALPIWV